MELIDYTGPLWSSSSNITGSPDIASIEEAKKIFGNDERVHIVDTGLIPFGIASTIYCFKNHSILREGKIKKNEVLKFLLGCENHNT